MIVKLSNPTKVNGSEITEVNLELEKLKGKDLLELESSFRKYNRADYVPVPNLDIRYQSFVAGRVSGINPEDLAADLDAPDFIEVCTTVQNFLLKSGSPARVSPFPTSL
jgi:hypothetical protein